jgi:hypothetical protein
MTKTAIAITLIALLSAACSSSGQIAPAGPSPSGPALHAGSGLVDIRAAAAAVDCVHVRPYHQEVLQGVPSPLALAKCEIGGHTVSITTYATNDAPAKVTAYLGPLIAAFHHSAYLVVGAGWIVETTSGDRASATDKTIAKQVREHLGGRVLKLGG